MASRARIFQLRRLGLGFFNSVVLGSDFRKNSLVSVSDFKRGTQRLSESRILPFYTPPLRVGIYQLEFFCTIIRCI